MRGAVADLPSPHPVVATLPGIYHGQPFLERFCGSLDDVLAPVVSTLDNLPAYLDVGTAPPDFLPWLAYWMGMPLGPGQSSAARRQVLRAASTQQGWQGTARGIVLVVEAVFGCRAEVEDSGGTTWSRTPEDLTAAPSARQPPSVVVRVDVPDGRVVDERRLDALVAALKPAHVAHRVEVRDGR